MTPSPLYNTLRPGLGLTRMHGSLDQQLAWQFALSKREFRHPALMVGRKPWDTREDTEHASTPIRSSSALHPPGCVVDGSTEARPNGEQPRNQAADQVLARARGDDGVVRAADARAVVRAQHHAHLHKVVCTCAGAWKHSQHQASPLDAWASWLVVRAQQHVTAASLGAEPGGTPRNTGSVLCLRPSPHFRPPCTNSERNTPTFRTFLAYLRMPKTMFLCATLYSNTA